MTTAAAQPHARDVELTFDDLCNLPDDGKLYELVRGRLVEKHMGFLALWVASQLSRLIGNYVDPRGRGFVSTEVPIGCFPWLRNHGRRPDVVYYHRERLP